MGYQALLFSPDEKLSSVVSQVFSELEFTIEPVHEPFAAVKKLMAQHFDVIVVDSENEQNASLLFKSARNSSFNQSSLAIALVEGQAGIAKAYRIGANLVLTKPINVEQTKGTLRVARGLLRKTADVAAPTAPSVPPPVTPTTLRPRSGGLSLQPDRRGARPSAAPLSTLLTAPESTSPWPAASSPQPVMESSPASTAAGNNELGPETPPQLGIAPEIGGNDRPFALPNAGVDEEIVLFPMGSAFHNESNEAHNDTTPEAKVGTKIETKREAKVETTIEKKIESKPEATLTHATSAPASVPHTSSTFTSAAAPAPAREVSAPPAIQDKSVESGTGVASSTPPSLDAGAVTSFTSVTTGATPSFAGLDDESSAAAGGSKKILIAAAIILALVAIGYLVYGKFSTPNGGAAVPPPNITSPAQSAPAPAPVSSPDITLTTTPEPASSADPSSSSRTGQAAAASKPPAAAGSPTVIRIAPNAITNPTANSSVTAKPDSSPLLVKANTAAIKAQAHADESEPQLPGQISDSSANTSDLNSLMSTPPSSIPKLSPSTLKVSQGVSEGLLIKRVQPTYPPAAIAVHAQGSVQIEATINKEGYVTNPKVIHGNSILAQAAVAAVRQWRYKPYYLDGQPVEIQTQITVNFKAN